MKKILKILAVAVVVCMAIDFVRFPECYLTTEKYQLQNAIKKGDTVAIEYYQNNYIANGRILFE
jgi:hypothetical protein